MNKMTTQFRSVALCLGLILLVSFAVPVAFAQNVVSGEIAGIVTDASGAVVANASITLNNKEMGSTQTTTTGATGAYRFPLLRPGQYTVGVTAKGFSRTVVTVTVSLGQVTNVPVALKVGSSTETVEVTAAAALVETETANLTANYSQQQMEMLPSPGNDMNNYAMSSPGVAVSTGAGYGNYSAFGMPGTSNLYTVNGADNNDPFNGLNNSGSSNNTLGTNELQEMTIVTNGYTAQYGRAAGANINTTTLSGTNQFHGNANWWWNGRSMNANDWINNNTETPKPFANSNQWAGRIGGPIKKDKLFFFYDNEGMRYVLPGGGTVYMPSPQLQAATLANIAALHPAELPFYQKAMGYWSGAPGAKVAKPVTTADDPDLGCGGLAGKAITGGVLGVSIPCAYQFQNAMTNMNKERLMSARVDWNATEKDKLAFRYWQDRGLQPTYTDPFNPIFNSQSLQPQDSGQVTWTRTISPTMVNQFIALGSYYSAIFSPKDFAASVAALGTTFRFNDGMPFNNMGGTLYSYPQGRNVTQWGLIDDFSWNRGNHALKFGVNLRRNDITDFTPFRNTSGYILFNDMTDFFNGETNPNSGSRITQVFEQSKAAPFAFYSLGFYGQDEWRVSNTLKVTMGLRMERNSNVTCRNNCFSRFGGSFDGVDHTATTPYNVSIQTHLSQAFPSIEPLVFAPRAGIVYSPRGNDKTVLRGGIGIFSDLYPASLAEAYVANAPYVATFNISNAGLVAPGVAGSAFGLASGSNTALLNGFAAGQTLAQIKAAATAAGGSFSVPAFTAAPDKYLNPKYVKWNVQFEQQLDQKSAVTVGYVGSHGYDLLMSSGWVNTYCTAAKCPNGFQGLGTAAPDSRFARVLQHSNTGFSNYNGLVATFTRRMTKGFTGSINYTYSHSLDTVSNGGQYGFNLNEASDSIVQFVSPLSARALNYGNSDYDFRHVLTAKYVWQLPFKTTGALNYLIGGWSVSGTLYARSGNPYSIIDSGITSLLSNATNNVMLAQSKSGVKPAALPCDGLDVATGSAQCQLASNYVALASRTSAGNFARNGFHGPRYFNTDFTVTKGFKVTESGVKFSIGANFFNVLNHPNFISPDGNLHNATFGNINATATPPSSPYGNFQGSAVSGRIIQTILKVEF